jgi:hypothetical protein
MTFQGAARDAGAEQAAVRWLRVRLAWERRLTELRGEAGSVLVDEIAHRRGASDTSPMLSLERLLAAS